MKMPHWASPISIAMHAMWIKSVWVDGRFHYREGKIEKKAYRPILSHQRFNQRISIYKIWGRMWALFCMCVLILFAAIRFVFREIIDNELSCSVIRQTVCVYERRWQRPPIQSNLFYFSVFFLSFFFCSAGRRSSSTNRSQSIHRESVNPVPWWPKATRGLSLQFIVIKWTASAM